MSRGFTLLRRNAFSRSHVAPGTVLFLDDFTGASGTDIDSTKWVRVVTRGGGNNEYDYRTGSVSNSHMDGFSNLEIVLRHEAAPDAGQPFTSARLETRGLKTFLWPVKLEARIRLPSAPGLWPAFWTDANAGGWPTTGEIDMVELPYFVDIAHGSPGDGTAHIAQYHVHMGSQASPTTNSQLGASYDTGSDIGSKIYTNLVPNPSLETNSTGYSSFGASSTAARVAGAAKLGGFGWRVTSGAAGAMQGIYNGQSLVSLGLAVGDTISAGWHIVTALAGTRLNLQFYGSGNTVFLSSVNGQIVTNGLSKVEAAVIPAGCDTIRFSTTTTATASGQTIDCDCLILVKDSYLPGDAGSGLHDYGDGSSTGWSWSAAANASSSTGPGSGDYHIYRADWFVDHIDFYHDGVMRASITRAQALAAGYQWPFDSNSQCLILNLAYSGDYPGNGTTTPTWTDLRMKVDYVKATAL